MIRTSFVRGTKKNCPLERNFPRAGTLFDGLGIRQAARVNDPLTACLRYLNFTLSSFLHYSSNGVPSNSIRNYCSALPVSSSWYHP